MRKASYSRARFGRVYRIQFSIPRNAGNFILFFMYGPGQGSQNPQNAWTKHRTLGKPGVDSPLLRDRRGSHDLRHWLGDVLAKIWERSVCNSSRIFSLGIHDSFQRLLSIVYLDSKLCAGENVGECGWSIAESLLEADSCVYFER